VSLTFLLLLTSSKSPTNNRKR